MPFNTLLIATIHVALDFLEAISDVIGPLLWRLDRYLYDRALKKEAIRARLLDAEIAISQEIAAEFGIGIAKVKAEELESTAFGGTQYGDLMTVTPHPIDLVALVQTNINRSEIYPRNIRLFAGRWSSHSTKGPPSVCDQYR